MHFPGVRSTRSPVAALAVEASAGRGAAQAADGGGEHTAPLRVDAQRNLEHVLRAAREVFGELGYGAPMEDIARRARVGVGTVYRRFPSKDVLVQRIAEEETARLTEQARAVLQRGGDPWTALSRFLRASVDSGAGRLLPPRILRAGTFAEPASGGESGGRDEQARARVPPQAAPQRNGPYGPQGQEERAGRGRSGTAFAGDVHAAAHGGVPVSPEPPAAPEADAGAVALLDVVGQLVERARAAGELRSDVTVSDVLLVMAAAAPPLPDPAQQAAASTRLLDILLEGLRPRS